MTFGIAPAFLAFAWGVRPVEEVAGSQLVQRLPEIGWVLTFWFVICGAARLARFNIDSGKPSSDRKHFVGLPIPGAAGVIAAIVHCIKYPVNDWMYSLIWLAIVGVAGFLMVSSVRYPSFKTFDLRSRRSYVAIIFIGHHQSTRSGLFQSPRSWRSLFFTHYPAPPRASFQRSGLTSPHPKRSMFHETRRHGGFRVAVVGSASLLGKELLAVLKERRFPITRLVTPDALDEAEPDLPVLDLTGDTRTSKSRRQKLVRPTWISCSLPDRCRQLLTR